MLIDAISALGTVGVEHRSRGHTVCVGNADLTILSCTAIPVHTPAQISVGNGTIKGTVVDSGVKIMRERNYPRNLKPKSRFSNGGSEEDWGGLGGRPRTADPRLIQRGLHAFWEQRGRPARQNYYIRFCGKLYLHFVTNSEQSVPNRTVGSCRGAIETD